MNAFSVSLTQGTITAEERGIAIKLAETIAAEKASTSAKSKKWKANKITKEWDNRKYQVWVWKIS